MATGLPVIPIPYIHSSIRRRKNTWYSIADGNWSNPATWISNGTKRYAYPGQNIPSPVFPQVGDNVYINHTVTLDVGTTIIPIVVNNIYISGSLTISSSITLSVNGDIQATGTVNMSNYSTLILYGLNNFIVNFIAATTSTVQYWRNIDSQPVMNLTYQNLQMYNLSNHFAIADLLVLGNLSVYGPYFGAVSSNLAMDGYKLTVTGIFKNLGGTIYQRTSDKLLFIGLFQFYRGAFIFSGNPDIEFRGGWYLGTSSICDTGTGIWSFTVNQSLDLHAANNINFNCKLQIEAGVTVTMSSLDTNMYFALYNVIDGMSSTSVLISKAYIKLMNLASASSMATGIIDITTYVNWLEYGGNYNFTIPYLALYNLVIIGTGTKSLSGNTVLTGALKGTGTLDISTYILEVKQDCVGVTVNASSGYILLTTNNQLFSAAGTANTIISGAITVTTWPYGLTMYGKIDGNNAASTFQPAVTYVGAQFVYGNPIRPMVTGILKADTVGNQFVYGGGDQDVTGATYYVLVFGGTGVKTLQGNIVVNTTAGGSWSITGSATINYNGFTITTV